MDIFNFDIDYQSYFDVSSPALKGAVAGGLLQWALGGGAQKFSIDWKDGINSLLVRATTSVLVGFPVQFLVENSGIAFLQNYKLLVTGGAIFFLIPFFSWAEKGLSTVTGKFIHMLPF